jgi:CBS domain-containing protein
MSLSVGQLMKVHVIAVEANDNLNTGLQRMTDAGVRHLPVVDRAGHLVGVVSQRDLVRAIDVMRTAEGARQPLRLDDVMRRDVRTVTAATAADEAATLMIEHKIGMLPVIDDKRNIVGIITETDFLEVARRALTGFELSTHASA